MTEIKLQLFGVFRDLEIQADTVQVSLPISVPDFKKRILDEWQKTGAKKTVDLESLLKSSAIATSSRVFAEGDQIGQSDTELAILPPVCGG